MRNIQEFVYKHCKDYDFYILAPYRELNHIKNFSFPRKEDPIYIKGITLYDYHCSCCFGNSCFHFAIYVNSVYYAFTTLGQMSEFVDRYNKLEILT